MIQKKQAQSSRCINALADWKTGPLSPYAKLFIQPTFDIPIKLTINSMLHDIHMNNRDCSSKNQVVLALDIKKTQLSNSKIAKHFVIKGNYIPS